MNSDYFAICYFDNIPINQAVLGMYKFQLCKYAQAIDLDSQYKTYLYIFDHKHYDYMHLNPTTYAYIHPTQLYDFLKLVKQGYDEKEAYLESYKITFGKVFSWRYASTNM